MPSMTNIVADIIIVLVIVAAYIYGKYISPKLHPGATNQAELAINELKVMGEYANKFVIWAREFLKGKPGTAKMDEVLARLQEITKIYKINMTDDQLKAIAQTAYESMKVKDEASSVQAIAEKAIDAIKETATVNKPTAETGDKKEEVTDEEKKEPISSVDKDKNVAMLSKDVKVIKEK